MSKTGEIQKDRCMVSLSISLLWYYTRGLRDTTTVKKNGQNAQGSLCVICYNCMWFYNYHNTTFSLKTGAVNCFLIELWSFEKGSPMELNTDVNMSYVFYLDSVASLIKS